MIKNINKKQQVSGGGRLALSSLLSLLVILFSGCNGVGDKSGKSFIEEEKLKRITLKKPVVLTATTDLYIKSAVYDNNATTTTADDTLYIYFNKAIYANSITADRSSNYVITGTGAIGSASASDYNDTLFHRNRVKQDGGSTGSLAISTANDTNISLAKNTIYSQSGKYPNDYNKTIVEKFRVTLKTGQTTVYVTNDDGTYQKGVARSYTDNGNATVTDNATGLVWQKEDDNTKRNWANAGSYCTALNLGGSTNWRLPTIEELVSITDKGKSNPAIDPVFTGTNSSSYWSSTTVVSSTSNAWRVNFRDGKDSWAPKTGRYYVRCVR